LALEEANTGVWMGYYTASKKGPNRGNPGKGYLGTPQNTLREGPPQIQRGPKPNKPLGDPEEK